MRVDSPAAKQQHPIKQNIAPKITQKRTVRANAIQPAVVDREHPTQTPWLRLVVTNVRLYSTCAEEFVLLIPILEAQQIVNVVLAGFPVQGSCGVFTSFPAQICGNSVGSLEVNAKENGV